MTARLAERRNEQRVASPLPVYFDNGTGMMRDMSASGAYFWTPNGCSVGEAISFSIGLHTSDGKTLWKCHGNVLRSEPQERWFGVAVKITSTSVEAP